ncbi:MAG: peptidylprolyl isomerase [Gallionella sp.]
MYKSGKLAALAILSALAINTAFAEDKSAASVNGVSIPQSRIDLRVKAAAGQGQIDSPELRKAVREDMINLELLAQESAKLGLDKNAEVVQQIELAKQSILAGAFVQDYAKNHPVSDDQLKQEFEKVKANVGNKEFKARHILVDTEAEAKAIIAQLGKKAKFEKLAAKSKDVGSASHGGELDWAVPSNFVPSFSNAMTSLKKGEYTKEPVQSQYGWHVIKLDDVRDLKMPAFDELKPQLLQRLQQQEIQNTIAEMRTKAKIE